MKTKNKEEHKMVAIKNWFLEKNNMTALRGLKLEITKETEKAVLVKYTVKSGTTYTDWIPKSCIIDNWEKDTSNFGYHDYLVNTLNEAYTTGKIENKTFTSGRNRYDLRSFNHQMTTKELQKELEKHEINYMNRKEWNNREA